VTIEELIYQLRYAPDSIEFDQVIETIDKHYDYTPTRFTNGNIINDAGTNEGSCKIFYFAQMHALSEMETLGLFGKFFREDVMCNPEGDDHLNIRNFILDGLLAIQFDGVALHEKTY